MNDICHRVFKRMYVIRWLVEFGIARDEMLNVYKQKVRSITEYPSICWLNAISVKEKLMLERTQKVAFHLILGKDYISYENALEVLNMTSLSQRREYLFNKFATKMASSERFCNWFNQRSSE